MIALMKNCSVPQADVETDEQAAEFGPCESPALEGGSAFKLYLREIGQVKRLTPREETAAVARAKKGSRQAREQLIKANLPLVVKTAQEYENIGLPLLDLISEGNLGLLKAVEQFDPATDGKLSSFSVWWIKQAIKRALATQSKIIRLPVPAAR
jgi:RNA polymerase primary sigma factor